MTAVKKKFRRRGIYLLPNLFTTAALFAGSYSIVAAVDGIFQKADAAIFIAMILDGIDGRVARLTNTSTQFGKEYDSLSGMVSFGPAPAVVVYQWGVSRLADWLRHLPGLAATWRWPDLAVWRWHLWSLPQRGRS